MKKLIAAILLLFTTNAAGLENKEAQEYEFLSEMYDDNYFPNHLVDKGKAILVGLCKAIEEQNPKGEEVYKLTHAATEKFNDLNNEFGENGSEIETAARENIGGDVEFILKAYGYNLDIEQAIAPRDW